MAVLEKGRIVGGRYRLERPLASGGMGAVWVATHQQLGRSAAVKFISAELATSPDQRLIINPGSVGQPRDNDARAAYGILDLNRMTWQHLRIPYPIELTQSQMRAARLPKRLVDRLSFGW